jgi:hypothetical protein
MMAALIMTGECAEPAIRDYRLGRFADGDLMRSEFDRGFQG